MRALEVCGVLGESCPFLDFGCRAWGFGTAVVVAR
jgi:hypothetical protein